MCEEEFVFVDIQGFKTIGNAFVVKEFCLVDGDYIYHTLVQSPCKRSELMNAYRREADWLTYVYHGLKFDSGSLTLYDLVRNTFERVVDRTVLVKGVEKVKWVKQIYNIVDNINLHCVNVEDTHSAFSFAVKPTRDIQKLCPHHAELRQNNIDCHCALANALELQDFVGNNYNHNHNSSLH